MELPTTWALDVYDHHSSIFTCIKHAMNEKDVLRQQDLGVNLLLQYKLSKTN